MLNIEAIIIDDEAASRENLILLLQRFTPQVKILEDFKNLKDGVAFLKKTNVDLVFLDVEMPDYAGYEIDRFFDKIPFEIIFITAYDKYAIKAFELSAIDYLLKPIEIDRLKEAIKKYSEKREIIDFQEKFQNFKNLLKNPDEPSYSIHTDGYKKLIPIKNIVAIEGQSAYAKIYTTSKDSFIVSKNIAEVEKDLAYYNVFYRCHKSWIINTSQISSYSKSKYKVVLGDIVDAKISRTKMKDFLEFI